MRKFSPLFLKVRRQLPKGWTLRWSADPCGSTGLMRGMKGMLLAGLCEPDFKRITLNTRLPGFDDEQAAFTLLHEIAHANRDDADDPRWLREYHAEKTALAQWRTLKGPAYARHLDSARENVARRIEIDGATPPAYVSRWLGPYAP